MSALCLVKAQVLPKSITVSYIPQSVWVDVMLKKRQINEKLLSDVEPAFKEKQNVSSANFCKELALFCEGYLKSAVNLYTRQLSSGVLAVSVEYFAYLLRLLLEATADMGAIDMYVDIRNIVAISFKFDSTRIDDDKVRRMFKIAMKAGFVCARNEEVFLLETALHQDRCLDVRANNGLYLYRVLQWIIFESTPAPIPNKRKKI